MRIPIFDSIINAFKEIINAFKEAARENDRKAEELKTDDEKRIEKRIRLQKLLTEYLSPKDIQPEEVVSRLRSIIFDESFGESHFYPDFRKRNPGTEQYEDGPMFELFIQTINVNALRVPPKDAIDFVRTLFLNNVFFIMDPNKYDPGSSWYRSEEFKQFFSHGLVPLAGKVHPDEKIKFFRACETDHQLKIFVENCAPDDVAVFLYNIFGEMKANDVESVLAQSDFMELVPTYSEADPEKLELAFDRYCGADMDSRLPYVFKKHMGWKPPGDQYYPDFEKHYPPGESDSDSD